MNAGRIAQDGTPKQIYEEPRSRFVMDFLGQVDHVAARVSRTPDGAYVAVIEGVEGAQVPLRPDETWQDGDGAVLAFRSVDVRVHPGSADGFWPGVIVSAVYLGERVQYVIKLGTAQVRAAGPAIAPLSKGTLVQVQIPMGAIRAWPAGRSSADA